MKLISNDNVDVRDPLKLKLFLRELIAEHTKTAHALWGVIAAIILPTGALTPNVETFGQNYLTAGSRGTTSSQPASSGRVGST